MCDTHARQFWAVQFWVRQKCFFILFSSLFFCFISRTFKLLIKVRPHLRGRRNAPWQTLLIRHLEKAVDCSGFFGRLFFLDLQLHFLRFGESRESLHLGLFRPMKKTSEKHLPLLTDVILCGGGWEGWVCGRGGGSSGLVWEGWRWGEDGDESWISNFISMHLTLQYYSIIQSSEIFEFKRESLIKLLELLSVVFERWARTPWGARPYSHDYWDYWDCSRWRIIILNELDPLVHDVRRPLLSVFIVGSLQGITLIQGITLYTAATNCKKSFYSFIPPLRD